MKSVVEKSIQSLTAPHRYTNLPRNADQVYRSICLTLSDRMDQVDWASFTLADWALLRKMADTEGVAPLMHWTFKRSKVETLNVPRAISSQLETAYYNNVALNQLLFTELGRILEALDEAVIPVIVLKGASLAETLYPDVALRPMSDLDLLVPRQHLVAAERSLQLLGYSKEHPYYSLRLNRRIGHHLNFKGGASGNVEVEIHWSLIAGDEDWRTPPISWFWEQTKEWEGRRPALIFTPTAQLLYLASHLTLQHSVTEARLLWLYDINLLIRQNKDSLNWPELITQAQDYGWESAMYAALNKVEEYFNPSIPEPILEVLAQTHDQRANYLVHRKTQPTQTDITTSWNRLLSLSWPARLHYVIVKTFPSPDFIRWLYDPQPEWLWPLYYPYRWLSLIGKGLISLKRLGQGMVTRR